MGHHCAGECAGLRTVSAKTARAVWFMAGDITMISHSDRNDHVLSGELLFGLAVEMSPMPHSPLQGKAAHLHTHQHQDEHSYCSTSSVTLRVPHRGLFLVA